MISLSRGSQKRKSKVRLDNPSTTPLLENLTLHNLLFDQLVLCSTVLLDRYRIRPKIKGTTLLETLCCIAVQMIVMSMMFPTFSQAVKKAQSLGTPVDPKDPSKGRYAPSSAPHLRNTIKGKRMELIKSKSASGAKKAVD